MTPSPFRYPRAPILPGCLFWLASVGSAEILFKAGFETGDLSEWSKTGTNSQHATPRNIQVVTDIVHDGKYAAKFTIHEDDVFNAQQLRVQVGGPKVTVVEGTDTYMAFSIYMAEAPKDRDNFFYWEGTPPPRWNNVMTWWVEPTAGGGASIKYGTGNLGRNGTDWEADFAIGKWHRLAMHIHWSEDQHIGYTRLWWDGAQVLDKQLKTKGPESVYFCQPGIHRSPHRSSVDTIYFDNFILADTLREVEKDLPKPAAAAFAIEGDWDVRVTLPGEAAGRTAVHVAAPQAILVKAEPHKGIPMFNPKAGGWARGAQLAGVKAQETTSPHLLDPASFTLRAGPGPDAALLTKGVDYEIDLSWGTFGRLEGSRIRPDQTVFASYRHAQMRLDAVVLTPDGKVVLRQGDARAAAPVAPTVKAGERHLGNIYLPGLVAKLEPEHLFPVLETSYPEPAPGVAKATVARLIRRLSDGDQPGLRILAWGDSVTDGSYLPGGPSQRWQEQFVTRLRERFPRARIELLTHAWGGRNTGSYLAEPPGSAHNYRETVLALKPDLIVSEFVNDASLKPEQVEQRYSQLLGDFQAIGAEWIILTPHYVRPDWMNLTRERDIDNDPRPYVEGLRQFAAKHEVALADASLRYGRLWRQGVPYNTLMLNAINHPDVHGMRIFADALMALFR